MKLTWVKKCPCCLSDKLAFYNRPERHLFCTVCFHRRKSLIPNDDYYGRLSGRSKMLENNLKKKNLGRLRSLRQYLKKGMKILEVGCAEGALGKALKRRLQVVYYGIEPSRDSAAARKKLDGIWDSLRKIPKNIHFDLILSFHVLEHINALGPHISELYKLLDDDGILILEVPNYFGNKRLPWDFNKEHIHLFSLTSVSCLLEKHGLEIREVSTGNYESAIYNDSIRVIAGKRKSVQDKKSSLAKRFKKFLGDRFVIYGMGGDFESLVLPYIKTSSILTIIDSSPKIIGQRIIGKTIQGPGSVAKYFNKRFLIATYRYQKEIFRVLTLKGISRSRIVTLEDIFSSEPLLDE